MYPKTNDDDDRVQKHRTYHIDIEQNVQEFSENRHLHLVFQNL